jgi:hypothetical protein
MVELETADGPMAIPGARCSFCGHDNPAAAKYCNECAADLALALCPSCSAVNKRDMSQCHKCGATLDAMPQQSAALPVSAEVAPEPSPPPRARRIIAFVLMATIGVIAAASAAYQTGAITPAAFTALIPAQPISHGSDASRAESTAAAVATPVPPPRDETEPLRDERIDTPLTQAMAPSKEEDAVPTPPAPAPSNDGCTDAVAALALCDRTPRR